MLEPAFFDTNLFLYAYSQAAEDRKKREVARSLFERHHIVLSLQVVQEFLAAALRKPAMGINEEKIDEFLGIMAYHTIQPMDFNTVLHATALRRRYSLSHWDSTIVATASEASVSLLYTEVLQPGFTYQSLQIINPFAL
jgi:predicted nucleic acid-binding protein